MTDEHNQRLQEEMDDAALGLLMEEYAQIQGEALWREFQAAEAAEKAQDALAREDRKPGRGSRKHDRRMDFLKDVGKCCKRAAVFFLILTALLSPVVMSVDAFRIPILDYFVAIEKTFSGFRFGRTQEVSIEHQKLFDLITAVTPPKGYFFVKQEIHPNGIAWLHFENDEKDSIRISFYPSDGKINIDTEDVELISMKLQDHEAVYLQKNGNRIVWMDAERELFFDVRAFELEEDVFWNYIYTLAERLSQ